MCLLHLTSFVLFDLYLLSGMFSVAIPVAVMTGAIIGLGVLIIDKQRELSHYRHISVGVRDFKLQEEHDQLMAFMKTATVPKEEIEHVPVPQLSK